ncbi:restriction endonuclease [Metabacillus sediminilitoris]|uniref:restriction endonuclease n=1 Tax=Metabacillus sediminilitoris TaxID=2567941 RepID=UPI001D0D9A9E|nr:restriction endonuclease [Metabacillus sediminilitoris]
MDIMNLIVLYLSIVVASVYLIIIYQANRQKRLRQIEERLSLSGSRDIDQMDGIEFERYLVVLFKKQGYQSKTCTCI